MDRAAVWAAVAEERVALADLLDGIDPAAWDAPSLCGDWTVQQVVGHLVHLAEGTRWSVFTGNFRAHPLPNKANDKVARREAAASTGPELAARLRAAAGGRFVVPGMPPTVALGEVLVHRSDITGAAGLPGLAVDDRMRAVLDAELKLWFAFGVARSAGKARWKPTDGDWEAGAPGGPVVEGPGQQLLLAATGRRSAIESCTGPGLALLTR